MITNWLMRRAQRTPYFHLDGYMNRWWLVPYNVVISRTPKGFVAPGFLHTDGTGPVTWRRPIAKLFQLCGIAIRVHEILRSDRGCAPHDHPWPYLTVVLRGGYWEHCFDFLGLETSVRWCGPGSVIYRPANSWHMLELPEGKRAITLFFTGRKCQTWGFNTRTGKVPYWQYKQGDPQ